MNIQLQTYMEIRFLHFHTEVNVMPSRKQHNSPRQSSERMRTFDVDTDPLRTALNQHRATQSPYAGAADKVEYNSSNSIPQLYMYIQ